jgi:hypothetical protein
VNLGPLEDAIRQVVREELALLLVGLGQSLEPGTVIQRPTTRELVGDLFATERIEAQLLPELRDCRECGSRTSKPCSAVDCGWPTARPVGPDMGADELVDEPQDEPDELDEDPPQQAPH